MKPFLRVPGPCRTTAWPWATLQGDLWVQLTPSAASPVSRRQLASSSPLELGSVSSSQAVGWLTSQDAEEGPAVRTVLRSEPWERNHSVSFDLFQCP